MNNIEKFTQDLRRKPFINYIINNLNGEVFALGGVVRDLILNKQNKDIDLVVRNIPIDTLIVNLEKFGKVDVVGKSFGVIKLIDSDGLDYDIALPRTEKMNGDGGYKGFDTQSDETLPIESDLIRRDAKMNAMAININTGKFIDPLNGLDDIKNKQISAANQNTFSDDPLRMLRMISFSARFGFTIEPKTMQMIQKNAGRIKEIPPERILGEFDKIIQKGDPIKGITVMVVSGIYKAVFGVDFYRVNIPRNKLLMISNMGEFIFALIYKNIDQPAEFFRTNLKGDLDSYKLIKALELSYTATDSNPTAMRMIAHNMFLTSPQSLSSKLIDDKVVGACSELLSGKYPKTVNELAVNGQDLMSLGLKGKEIGDMQKSLLIKIYADKLQNNKEDILEVIGNKDVEEGVGDKYAANKFGIPDQNADFEKDYELDALKKSQQPFGYIKVVPEEYGYKEYSTTPVYLNPKSLNNFGMNVRGISDIKGNLYVAAVDGNFNHGKMGFDLGLANNDFSIYPDNNYLLLHRIGKTNSFGLADSSDSFMSRSEEEHNRGLELLKLLKLKNPQFEYFPVYFASAHKSQPISLNENVLIKKHTNTKDALMRSKNISKEMKEKIIPYLTSNSEYIEGGKVLDLSKPNGFREKTSKSDGVSLGVDKNGFFCYTHRAASKRYESPEKIPVSAIEFIESTG